MTLGLTNYEWDGAERRSEDIGPPLGIAERRGVDNYGSEPIADDGERVDVLADVIELDVGDIRAAVSELYDDIESSETSDDTDAVLADVVPFLVPFHGDQEISTNTMEPPLRAAAVDKKAEREPKFTIRPATAEDIADIVDVDMQSFASVYDNYGQTEEEIRRDMHNKFMTRLEVVGSEWMPVLERDGKIVGVMSCCPTNKTPEAFSSWEETTDNGTLATTYDPNGKNVYVVTWAVLPEGSYGKDMLVADQIGKLVHGDYERAFFESRMPGLRDWVDEQCAQAGLKFDELTDEQKHDYADTYFQLKVVRGKKNTEMPYDELLRTYYRIGCNFLKVYPGAYQDEPSMDYGVLTTYEPASLFNGRSLPIRLPQNRLTRRFLGAVLQKAARSPKLTRMIFS